MELVNYFVVMAEIIEQLIELGLAQNSQAVLKPIRYFLDFNIRVK
jgi:hypothetical protein